MNDAKKISNSSLFFFRLQKSPKLDKKRGKKLLHSVAAVIFALVMNPGYVERSIL